MPCRRIPSYRHYKPKNLGLVVIDGKYHYLGKYGTPESFAEYNRLKQNKRRAVKGAVERLGHPDDHFVSDHS